jgi:hypothetical protein
MSSKTDHKPPPFMQRSILVQIETQRRVNDSSTYLIKGERKNSITLLSPVLISAVTAIPGATEISLSLTLIVKCLGLNLIL